MNRIRGNDGYVTLAVLVIAGLLAGLVSSLLTVSRPALDLARIGADETAVDAMLDGALTAAGYLLYAAKRDLPQVDGMALQFGTGMVALAVTDESGHVDLNGSTPELLAGLFRSAGGRSLQPDAFAARVVDWRDADDDVTLGGAETGDYSGAGASYSPRNAPFRSVDELRYLLGLSREDVERLRAYLTVYNVAGTIDPFSAERIVLEGVPGVNRADVTKFLKARAEEPKSRDTELMALLGSGSEVFREDPSGVYRVRLKAQLVTGARGAAQAVISAPASETADFGVVSWAPLPSTPVDAPK
jgi:general secretion pathway protein K